MINSLMNASAFNPVAGQTTPGSGALSKTLGGLLDDATAMSAFKTPAASNTFINSMGSSFGSSAPIINAIITGGAQGQSSLSSLLNGILGGGSSNILNGILAGGGMNMGMGGLNIGQSGIYANIMGDVGTDMRPGLFNSLLSSSMGKADLFGGTGPVMGQVFQMLRTPIVKRPPAPKKGDAADLGQLAKLLKQAVAKDK